MVVKNSMALVRNLLAVSRHWCQQPLDELEDLIGSGRIGVPSRGLMATTRCAALPPPLPALPVSHSTEMRHHLSDEDQ